MASRIVGQDLAVSQASDAICDHLGRARPDKPLVLSAHGPPGVGKSLMHLMAARALHCRQPGAPGLPCPGTACPGYRVSFDTCKLCFMCRRLLCCCAGLLGLTGRVQ